MRQLAILRDSDIFPGSVNADPKKFGNRKAVRAILMNAEGNIALLEVRKYRFHKLPGGGVEDGEDELIALQRELLEELGCQATIQTEIGEIIEYKNDQRQKHMSHCWLAEQIGEMQPPAFTEKEIAEGFRIVWATDIGKAIALLKQDNPANYTGSFIRKRDLIFLEAAKALT